MFQEQVEKFEDNKKKLIVQFVDYEELKAKNEQLIEQIQTERFQLV